MTDLIIVMPVHEREELTRRVCRHYSKFSKNIQVLIVYSDVKDGKSFTEFGFNAIYRENEPLIDKFNAGFQYGKQYGCPIAIVGSDDIISENYFHYAIDRMKKGDDCVGIYDCKLVDIPNCRMLYWGGYNTVKPFHELQNIKWDMENLAEIHNTINKRLYNESIGAGRVFGLKFLEQIDFSPFYPIGNNPVGHMDESNIDLLYKYRSRITNTYMAELGFDYWNVKSGEEFNHINAFETLYQTVNISEHQGRFWEYYRQLGLENYKLIPGLALNMVVYNESTRLNQLLYSNFFDMFEEVVVVDQESTDGSEKIIEKFATKYIKDRHTGYCESSRQLANDSTRSPWVLCLDADEKLSPYFTKELSNLVTIDGVDGYFCPFENLVNGNHDKVTRFEERKYRLYKRDKVKHLGARHTNPEPTTPHVVQLDKTAILHHRTNDEWLIDHYRFEALNSGKYKK